MNGIGKHQWFIYYYNLGNLKFICHLFFFNDVYLELKNCEGVKDKIHEFRRNVHV